MGRSTTLTFIAETTDQTGTYVITWNTKTHGKPTDENAARYRKGLNDSFLPGGVNEHVITREGAVIHTSKVKVIRQSSGEVVAKDYAPLFEVV